MSLDPLGWLLLLGALIPVSALILAGLITWAAIRSAALVPLQESPLGWLRLGLSFWALALMPIWGIVTAFVLYSEYDMEVAYLVRAGLVSMVLVFEGAAMVVALALGVRGSLSLWDHLRQRRAVRRYEQLVGDGAVLRPHAWHQAVLDLAEE